MQGNYRQGLLRLKCNRNLSYAIYGDFDGKPILFFHGWPGTRNDISCFIDVIKNKNSKIIAVDRPGYVFSDNYKNRLISDFPSDILQLLNHLGLKQVPILGFSTGGLYAFEVALQQPNLVTSLNLVSAVPYFNIEIDKYILNPNVKYLKNFLRWPSLIKMILQIVTNIGLNSIKRKPVREYNKSLKNMPKIDRDTWSREEIRKWFLEIYLPDLLQSNRKGVGLDLYLVIEKLLKPTEIEKSNEINVPVNFWHGYLDDIIPIEATLEQAKLFTNAFTKYYPKEGHKVIYTHLDEILTETLNFD